MKRSASEEGDEFDEDWTFIAAPPAKTNETDSAAEVPDGRNWVIPLLCMIIASPYVPLVCWGIWKDRNEDKQPSFTIITSKKEGHRFVYLITIITGWQWGAGTTAKVGIRLHGKSGITQPVWLSKPPSNHFRAGAEDNFIITYKENVGRLVSVELMHDNSGASPDWFVSLVVVRNLLSLESWLFVFDKWLQADVDEIIDDSDVCEITEASKEDALLAHKWYHIAYQMKQTFMNSHLWLSIFYRPFGDTFSRPQRITCAFAAVFHLMTFNLMYREITSSVSDSYMVDLFGFIRITWLSANVALKSGLSCFLLDTFVHILFRKSAPLDHTRATFLKSKLKQLTMRVAAEARKPAQEKSLPGLSDTASRQQPERTESRMSSLSNRVTHSFSAVMLNYFSSKIDFDPMFHSQIVKKSGSRLADLVFEKMKERHPSVSLSNNSCTNVSNLKESTAKSALAEQGSSHDVRLPAEQTQTTVGQSISHQEGKNAERGGSKVEQKSSNESSSSDSQSTDSSSSENDNNRPRQSKLKNHSDDGSDRQMSKDDPTQPLIKPTKTAHRPEDDHNPASRCQSDSKSSKSGVPQMVKDDQPRPPYCSTGSDRDLAPRCQSESKGDSSDVPATAKGDLPRPPVKSKLPPNRSPGSDQNLARRRLWESNGGRTDVQQTAEDDPPWRLSTPTQPPHRTDSGSSLSSLRRSANKNDNSNTGRISADDLPKSVIKSTQITYWFPSCCLYIAWMLPMVSCVVCSYIMIAFSHSYDYEKSVEWSISTLLSFLQSVIVIQPIKVFIMVLVFSLVFRKTVSAAHSLFFHHLLD